MEQTFFGATSSLFNLQEQLCHIAYVRCGLLKLIFIKFYLQIINCFFDKVSELWQVRIDSSSNVCFAMAAPWRESKLNGQVVYQTHQRPAGITLHYDIILSINKKWYWWKFLLVKIQFKCYHFPDKHWQAC